MLRKLWERWTGKGYTLTDPRIEELFGIAPSSAGYAVNRESALRVPAVAAAVRLISETVGTLPCHVHRNLEAGGSERATEHPAQPLIHDGANPWTSAGALRTAVTADAILDGNGYSAVLRNFDGKPLEMHRLEPTAVTLETGDARPPVYVYREKDGGERRYAYSDVVHIASPFTRCGVGQPLTSIGRDAIGLAGAMQKHAGFMFANGARPSGILSTDKKLSPGAGERIKKSWVEAHGAENSAGTAVLEEGMTWSSVSMDAVDSEFTAQQKFAVEQIARVTGVPPHMLYELGRATWSNAAEMGQLFLTLCLQPWLAKWEDAYRRTLIKPEERSIYKIEFLTDALTKADIEKRTAAYKSQIDGGFLTPNEARAAENRPPLPGGDKLRQAGANTPAEKEEEKIDE